MYSNLSPEKLQQVATDCGGTIAAVTVGQLLANPAYDLEGVAAALSTTPIQLQHALDRDETGSFMLHEQVTA
jgi:hypothetical protein